MKSSQIVVALIRLAGLQSLWTAFWNLTYLPEHKARYFIEVNGLPKSAAMTLISIKMITFRCALQMIFALTLYLFAYPLARFLARDENGAAAAIDPTSDA